jgi:hypothetical protein
MQETWLPVPGYENSYEVCNFGEVRSIDRVVMHGKGTFLRKRQGQPLKKLIDKQNKFRVSIYKNGIRNKVFVHYLVALAFLGQREKGQMVCHNDGNGQNNRADNLRYDTHKSNMEDMVKHDKSAKGIKNGHAVITEEQVFQVRELRKKGLLYKEISTHAGVHFETVAKICQGKRWDWLS